MQRQPVWWLHTEVASGQKHGKPQALVDTVRPGMNTVLPMYLGRACVI